MPPRRPRRSNICHNVIRAKVSGKSATWRFRVTGRDADSAILENFLYLQSKQTRDAERQWQTGVVFAGLYRIDSLPRDIEFVCQGGLGEFVLRTQDSELILHRYFQAQ